MRDITKIIIHCSATPEGRITTVQDITRWHLARGFQTIGYHYVIYLDGSVHPGRPESVAGAHTKGHNSNSIGICYVGGMDKGNIHPMDTRTPAQKAALIKLVSELKTRFPNVTVHGHREFANKACPSFDVKSERYD